MGVAKQLNMRKSHKKTLLPAANFILPNLILVKPTPELGLESVEKKTFFYKDIILCLAGATHH